MKIGNLYDLESFKAFADSAKQKGFSDAYAGTILARSLTHVNATVFEKKYQELAFVNSGITADNTGGYAQQIQSKRLIELGGFTNSADDSANKGKISLAGEQSFLKVVQREASSDWSDTEIKQAAIEGVNLPSQYVATHNKIYMREVDEIGLLGVNGVNGLLNNSAFVSGAASGAIGTLTAQQMYDEVASVIVDQRNAVNNTPEYSCNKVVMPVTVMNTLQITMLNTANGSSTVLKALRDNFPDVAFETSFRAASVGGSSATVAYSTSSDAMIMRIPQALTIGEIVKKGSFDFHVDSKYRIAGLDVLEATSGRILTGL